MESAGKPTNPPLRPPDLAKVDVVAAEVADELVDAAGAVAVALRAHKGVHVDVLEAARPRARHLVPKKKKNTTVSGTEPAVAPPAAEEAASNRPRPRAPG